MRWVAQHCSSLILYQVLRFYACTRQKMSNLLHGVKGVRKTIYVLEQITMQDSRRSAIWPIFCSISDCLNFTPKHHGFKSTSDKHIMFNNRNKYGISKHPCIFMFVIKRKIFSNKIKYPFS